MLDIKWFEDLDDLCALTGLTRDLLWDAGFNLDDWDFGIRCDRKLHADPTPDEIASGEYYEDQLVVDWDLPGYRLMYWMEEHCCGASYVELDGWYYYLVHHA